MEEPTAPSLRGMASTIFNHPSLHTLQKWIYKAHGDPFRFTTKEKFALRFKEAKQSLKNTNGMTGNILNSD